MRILSPPTPPASFPLISNIVARLMRRGWTSAGAGASGAYVLKHNHRKGVVKLGTDPGFQAFLAFLRLNSPAPALPTLYGATDVTFPWTGLYCEKLDPMTAAQVLAWEAWVIGDWQSNKGAPLTDPFGVASMLNRLRAAAIASRVDLDVRKPDNVMVRPGTSQLVFSDPFV